VFGTEFLNQIDNDELIDHLNRKAYVRRRARGRILKTIITIFIIQIAMLVCLFYYFERKGIDKAPN